MSDDAQAAEKVALTDAEVNELYRRWQQKVNFTYMLAAVERIVAARVAEAVDRERAASLRPWEADLLIKDAVERERAAWAAKSEDGEDNCSSCGHREHHGRCSFGGWACGCGRF